MNLTRRSPSPASCPRRWEVEACRDGRLSGEARASHLDHASSCPVCSREQQALDRLRLELGTLGEPDELSVRRLQRLRPSMLERADALLAGRVPRPRRSRPPAAVLAFAACLLASLASLASLGVWPRRALSEPPTALAPGLPAPSLPAPQAPVLPPAPPPAREVGPDPDKDLALPPAAPTGVRPPILAPRPRASEPEAVPEGLEEDTAYLRLVALLREGRREEAARAASDYLRRFPRGFRRPEVERLSR
jgi:hypothetical protein